MRERELPVEVDLMPMDYDDDYGVDRTVVTRSIGQVMNWLPGVETTDYEESSSPTRDILGSSYHDLPEV